HPFLINYLHSQLFRLIELRTRIRSGDNIVRFLADRPRDLPARIFDHLLGFVARVMSQGSSEHECFAGQFGATLFLLACELEAGFAQLLDQFAIPRLTKKLRDALCYAGSYFVYFEQFLLTRVDERVHGAEMLGQKLRRALAHETDAKAIDNPLQRQLLGVLDFVQHILGRFITHAFEFQQIGLSELVDIGDIPHHAAIGELIYQSIAQSIDVHYAARREVDDGLAKFGWAIGVDAAMIAFTSGYARTRSVFVCDRPARGLSGVSQLAPQRGAIHIYDDAINLIGKLFALVFPLLNEGPHFIEILRQRAPEIHFETHGFKCI